MPGSERAGIRWRDSSALLRKANGQKEGSVFSDLTAVIESWAASWCQPWFLVFDRADFREDFVRFALP
jgi:hypothetical protein